MLIESIIFLDSLQFYKGSLDSLASNLENNDFKQLLSEFPPNKLEIWKRKEAYSYEWVDSYEKFDHQELSLKERFYSSLKYGKRDNDNGHISDNQYLHLKMLWNTFNFNTFRDFHNHYLKRMYYY